jgi:hypothetical protein
MIPDEIAKPIKDFMTKNKWVILLIISIIAIGVGYIFY